MHQGLQDEIRLIIYITLLALVAGFITGEYMACLLIVGFLYSCWLLFQTRRFYDWLSSNMENIPPDSGGIWGDIIKTLYHFRQNNLKIQADLQQQVDRIQGFTSALRSGIILLSAEGNIIWWNQSAGDLLGLKQDFDTDKPIINLMRNPQFIDYYQRLDTNDTVTIPSPINPNILIQIQITTYGENEKLLSIQNVTRLKQLEQMRKDFVSNVSHELRTPLTVINGYLESMNDCLDDFGDDWKQPIQKITNQADRMTDLVNDLAVLSRMDNSDHADKKDRINIQSVLRRISEEAKQMDSSKEVHINISGENFTLLGSETEIHSCCSNLILNAIKYSKDYHVHIEIVTRKMKNGAEVSIADDGIGIDPAYIPRLTERFYRVDSSHSRQTGGSGLGLAIVKHALQRHDGVLKIESAIGKGSTFTCQFGGNALAED